MQCPSCETQLTMSERQGIEIDYCPSCRGVWLDRGELDKVIERNAAGARRPAADWDHSEPGARHPNRQRRKGFLKKLFD